MKKVIELSLSSKYVKHWTVDDALRELYQNAIDRAEDWPAEMITRVNFNSGKDTTLVIGNEDTTLDINTLLLGETNKTDNLNMIGKFGEGYKLAFLVLCREGYTVTVDTGSELWTPYIEQSDNFDAEVLKIEIETDRAYNTGTRFIISGIEEEVYNNYEAKNLHLTPGYPCIKTSNCEVLTSPEHLGKIFVGGLYVCDYKGTVMHGYNFKPGIFELGRDRQVIAGFNLAWEASKALVEASINDIEMTNSILDNIDNKETEYLRSFVDSDNILVNAAWDRFIAEYKDHVPVSSDSEAKRLRKEYIGIKTVVVNDRIFELLEHATGYKELRDNLKKRPAPQKPETVINKFYDKYKDKMRKEVREAFAKELMLEAIDWRVE